MSFLWRLESLIEDWLYSISRFYQSTRNRMSGSSVIALVSLAATIGSTAAAFLAWDAARNANQVSAASQALTLKFYNDQIALGHPSISVLSGQTTVSAVRQSGYREGVHDYVATLILRNSGQRDSPRAWVALYADAFSSNDPRASLVTLPKETDVGVRLPIGTLFGVDEDESSWFIAVLYQDEVPSPDISSASELSSPQSLRMVCAPPIVFRMTSWPKDPDQDPAIRVFSSGAP
ncbi:hypothetical protein C4J93_2080 [Pseudomonas sp. R2-37-08W]|uniref:hypothetical protein n=1 Tax=Pseudomonas sp. R2-37-08W TaxID=1173273 RepID=UPI000F5797B8|nr:hypothetical protein [Pseudomonas sp. R2-37-08W]AZF10278.1 hypothetical protein C4J93_2080 [Pseudomonas sp. R2-37-08W]